MKKALLLFIFLFIGITKTFACKCDTFGSIGENYSNSDLIGEVTITKIYGNNKKERTYKADVVFDTVYKGKTVNTLTIEGLIGDIQTPACEIELNAGEKYLIYLSQNEGEYHVSACTPKFLTGNKIQSFDYKVIDLQRKALKFLSENPQTLDFAFYFDDSAATNNTSDFSKLTSFTPTYQFAIYKVKVNERSRVTAISTISAFGPTDSEVERIIKKNFAVVKGFMEEVRNKEVLLLLFYVPENKNKEFKDIITNNLDE